MHKGVTSNTWIGVAEHLARIETQNFIKGMLTGKLFGKGSLRHLSMDLVYN
jgi:hypothetical protein